MRNSAVIIRDDFQPDGAGQAVRRNQSGEGFPIVFSIEALIVIFALFAIVICVGASVRILREYERAVVFTLGRFQKVKGPGLVLLIPFIQEMVRVDLRIQRTPF